MPIEVQHQPPLNIVGAGAYNAGVMEGVAKRREEIWNHQMQLAQMQQADRAQRLNLIGQQQAQQSANQRMLMENYFDQQNMAAQNQQRIQAFGMEQQAQMQRDSRLHDFDMQKIGKQQDFQVMEQANQSRGELEQMLGQAQALNLTPAGQELQSRIHSDLEELNKNIGSLRPSDYNFAIQEMLGRAKGLQLPRMQQPAANPADEIKSQTFDNPDDGYSYTKTDKGWKREGRHTVNGHKVGEVFRTPTGQDVYYDKSGDLKPVPSEIPKLKANVMAKVEESMAAEEKGSAADAPIPTFGPDGRPVASPLGAMPAPEKPAWSSNPQLRQAEKMRRFWAEWSVISGEENPYDRQFSPPPTGGQMVEHAMDPNSYRSNQPVMTPPQPQMSEMNQENRQIMGKPQVTAANPSGQPQQQQPAQQPAGPAPGGITAESLPMIEARNISATQYPQYQQHRQWFMQMQSGAKMNDEQLMGIAQMIARLSAPPSSRQ